MPIHLYMCMEELFPHLGTKLRGRQLYSIEPLASITRQQEDQSVRGKSHGRVLLERAQNKGQQARAGCAAEGSNDARAAGERRRGAKEQRHPVRLSQPQDD
eukprot:9476353-Pyramimonas_sp.AAC.1